MEERCRAATSVIAACRAVICNICHTDTKTYYSFNDAAKCGIKRTQTMQAHVQSMWRTSILIPCIATQTRPSTAPTIAPLVSASTSSTSSPPLASCSL